MPLPHPKLPPPPVPTKTVFDPFHSSSTGHQCAENGMLGSISWRESRTYKLSQQLKDASGRGGGEHVLFKAGAGSAEFRKNGRKTKVDWEKGAPVLRDDGWQDIRGLMRGENKRGRDTFEEEESGDRKRQKGIGGSSTEKKTLGPSKTLDSSDQTTQTNPNFSTSKPSNPSDAVASPTSPSSSISPALLPQIFSSLTLYLNGSTLPLISDHKLKSLFASHGGTICLSLARRTVTHVILGETGLAAGKIQKEFKRVGGEGIRYVTAQWVTDSVAAGRRQREGPYTPKVRIGGSRQKSVGDIFGKVDVNGKG